MRINISVSGLAAAVLLSACPLLMASSRPFAAEEASINGVVSDAAGKPIRGAIVKATLGTKTIARYTDAAGRYQIQGLEPGPHVVAVGDCPPRRQYHSGGVAREAPRSSRVAVSDPTRPDSGGYDVTVDSKGIPWVTQINLGLIFRLDPETGQTKIYHTPQMYSARGITVDVQDNLWYADYHGHKLGKLDPKTGKVTVYQPPNSYASPYGVTVDRRRGYVWYADTTANNVTRFDPKGGAFTEYAIPTPNAAVRFVGVDPQGRVWHGGFWNQKLGMIDSGDEPRKLLSSR